jgi:hypothetical protein
MLCTYHFTHILHVGHHPAKNRTIERCCIGKLQTCASEKRALPTHVLRCLLQGERTIPLMLSTFAVFQRIVELLNNVAPAN